MPFVTKRELAKADLIEHYVYLAENASIDVADRFLDVCVQRRHLDTATAECEHGVHQELEGGHHGRHQTSGAQAAQ